MAFTTKLNLTNDKFFQGASDRLSLTGTTSFGYARFANPAVYIATPTINNALQVPHAGYVTGQTAGLQSQIDYISGVTDTVSGLTVTNAGNISTNAADIVTVSGLTVTNAGNISTNAADIVTVSGLTVTNAADIVTVSGLTVTNAGNISTNAADIVTVSGLTVTNAADIVTVSGLTVTNAGNISTNAADIVTVSGLTVTNAADIVTVSGLTVTNAADIVTVSGLTVTNAADIVTVSGLTVTNAGNISTNAADIVTVSGLTVTNAGNIAVNTSDISNLAAISGLTESALQTANNGLTVDAKNVKLGGNLTGNTTIGLDSGNLCFVSGTATSQFGSLGTILNFNGSCLYLTNSGNDFKLVSRLGSCVDLNASGLTYGGDYSSCFKANTLVTKAYVDSSSGAISASNGLTRVDNNITLGGALTGNTTINGAHNLCLGNVGTNLTELQIHAGSFSSQATGTMGLCSIGNASFCSGTGTTTFDGSCVCVCAGAFYDQSYAGSLTARWLPDAAYVTGLTNSLATSKLSCSDFNSYTGTTDTRLDTIEDDITGNTAAIGVNASDISNLGAISGLTESALQTANNGLTVDGKNVKLGGTLTGATTIDSGLNKFMICSSSLNEYNFQETTQYSTSCTYHDFGNYRTFQQAFAGTGGTTCAVITQAACDTTSSAYSLNQLKHNGWELLHHNGTNGSSICVDNGQMLVSDAINCKGLVYAGDYTGQFDACSLVTKAYVDSAAGGISASNGLTRVDNNITLGGALTGNTTISSTGDVALIVSADFVTCCQSLITFEEDSSHIPSVPSEGMLYYSANSLNFVREFPDVVLQIGEESVMKVANNTGGLITNGSVVYISGSDGTIPEITKAIASDMVNAQNVVGLVTADIADTANGYVTLHGAVRGLNTAGLSGAAGSPVYLS